jgi:hydroxymethylbilane synthase
MNAVLRIGTRSSALALWQSAYVKDLIERRYPDLRIRLIHIKTTGDRILDSPLSKIGDKGLFTKELEHALLDNRIDIAVHSLKDVTTVLPEGLTIGAVTEREDIRDVFISHPQKKYTELGDVPVEGIIATGSLRRRCQLLAHRPDLRIADIRGNINTRIQKLDESDWDGMILALAGLRRLGLQDRVTHIIEPEIVLPAVGQGALGIEIREDDNRLIDLVAFLDHFPTRCATTAERALLRELEGGCQIPVGAWGRMQTDNLVMDACVGSLDGSSVVRGTMRGNADDAQDIGVGLAHDLLRNGADKILAGIRGTEQDTSTQ